MGDLLPPSAFRRTLARMLDLAVCWYGACAVAAAALPAARADGSAVSEEGLRVAALAVFAVVSGAVVPMLRRDRATPGQAASYLALASAGPPRPAGRWRALVRSALLFVPATALLATGMGWWALLVAALHGAPALVRRDRAGLFDLIAGTRTTTRTWVAGGMPDELMTFSRQGGAAPPAPAGAVPAQR
ncbi:RDD family protein [Streptomonospora wellingtoniae]|uniref:RDD family protein n=1 Tax=Streptomonospora wellingtoniae TaxID=3075544 RepID=A0ABU2KQV6_9ACTN|nr:RDD family protein [Streptomonospora sp. DSM 45055]MDT0301662.1 RDD family protein [Streptomonospora sp. DSM 45055]